MERISPRLLSWASILEEGTRAQAKAIASMPFVSPHMALMPDAHLGLGATVGSVIPTADAVIPAAAGIDVRCGMDAVPTQFRREDLAARGSLAPLRTAIARAVPLSAGRRNVALTDSAAPRVAALTEHAERISLDPRVHARNWALQLGSLGSGNHFPSARTH